MRLAMPMMLLAAVMCTGCTTPERLESARAGLAEEDRDRVRALTHAEPGDATRLRQELVQRAYISSNAAITVGEVAPGMSAADALRAWGEPDEAKCLWLLTGWQGERWRYHDAGLPDIELWLEHGAVYRVAYRAKGKAPEVPRGNVGWMKKWPARKEFAGASW